MSKLKFIEKTKEEKKVNNIKHVKVSGNVINDKNEETKQDLNILVKDDDTMMALWSYFAENKYQLASVLDIAKNFEKNHDDYHVLAAINADYFYMRSIEDVPVNASVIFNNRILNPKNHYKYQALKFNKRSNDFEVIKETKILDNLVLSIYEDNKLIDKQPIYLDDLTKNFTITNNTKGSVGYNIKPSFQLISDELFFIEGVITNEESDYKIITKNNYKLNINQKIKIQFEIENLNEDEMLVGFDGKIITNNKVLEFDEMTGQNLKHNTDRHPRTAIGIDKEGKIAFGAVDGRLENSVGVDNREFAKILNQYGFVEAYNLDGGGSTQVVLRVDDELIVVNTPSELPLRPVTNAILFIKKV